MELIEARYGKPPDEILVDGRFASLGVVEEVSYAERTTTAYATAPEPKDAHRDPHAPRPGDSEAVGAWRERMGTDEAKAIYRERASTAECVNAMARTRGLQRFRVRGLSKGTAVLLLLALAHDRVRGVELRRLASAGG